MMAMINSVVDNNVYSLQMYFLSPAFVLYSSPVVSLTCTCISLLSYNRHQGISASLNITADRVANSTSE
jgi:hypothetical protein